MENVEKIPNVRFMIVGGGYAATKKNVIGQIEQFNLQKKFLLTGVLGNVVPALAAFDVSVLCSDTEGMSNSVIQSIAMGKATVVTNVGGNPEVIEDGLNGLLVPADDPKSLAAALIKLHKDSKLKKQIELQASKIASEKFNIFPIIVSLQNVYLDLMESKH
ncbi:hypothetical protein MNBD_GAMMA22-2525 [hydrothermal vent metagenome]|uniref:Glycosyl transferase family 1 domain-containing protein n=1 Tax=hydrothermal vent metagenome TaxID=652676 RepID=A0A3B0ZV64_9ZZZZ